MTTRQAINMTVMWVRENLDRRNEHSDLFMIRMIAFSFEISRADAEVYYNEAVRIIETEAA